MVLKTRTKIVIKIQIRKNMKTISKRIKVARRITGCVFGAAAMVLIPYVCVEWHRQGCGWWSLVAAIGFYGGSLFAIWFAIDQALQGK